MWGGANTAFKAKSPSVDKWSHGYIKRSIGFVGYFFGQLKYVCEHLVGLHLFVTINFRDNRTFVESRHGLVYLVKCGHNFFIQIIIALINNAVCGAKHCSAIVLIGCILLLLDDVDSAYYKQQQKWNLPKQAAFSIWSVHLFV